MNKKIMTLLGLILIILLIACRSNESNMNGNRYVKLSEFMDGTTVSFIDSKTQEIIFVDMINKKLEKRVSIK